MSPLLWALASWLWSHIARPSVVTCPRGMFIHGVRPSGQSECIQSPGPDDGSCFGDAACTGDGPEPVGIPVRVWCDEGEIAVVVDSRTAECRRRGVGV